MSEEKTFTISELYVVVGTNQNGCEGVASCLVEGTTTMIPLVGGLTRLEELRTHATELSRISGIELKLCKFSSRELLEVFKPDDGGKQ